VSLAIYNSAAFSTASGVAIAPSAAVEVRRESDGALAAIYSDEAGTAPIAQPGYAADAQGRFAFYAAGLSRGYWVKVTFGAEVFNQRNVAIGTGAQLDAGATGAAVLAAATPAAARVALEPTGADGQVLVADAPSAMLVKYVTLGAGSVRQSVLQAVTDANGYANEITTGAGLRPGLSATSRAAVMTFASGFGPAGSQDLVSTLSADVADPLAADLAASNTSFLHATYTSPVAVVWGKTLVPPQYGYAFDRARQALLNFEGTNGATTTTDDFGNTWTLTGATISTAQFKFGASSLDCTGGTAKRARTTNVVTLGDGSWEISVWFRLNALPAASAYATLISAQNASSNGARLFLQNVTGTIKLTIFLSGDGAASNIVSAGVGTNTTWALNQWNKVRFVFDALGGNYKVFLSLNGAAETTDYTLASTTKVCAITEMQIGSETGNVNIADAWFDAFRFVPCLTVAAAETPAAVAPAIGNHPVHWFSIPEMKMYEATAASVTAGVNPTLTQRNRLFVAEADTSGAAVTAVRNYALRGRYRSPMTALPLGDTTTVFASNIGTTLVDVRSRAVCVTNENLGLVGDQTEVVGYVPAAYCCPPGGIRGRNSVLFIAGTSGILSMMGPAHAAQGIQNPDIKWQYYVEAERTF
jgi:hypothetical protein